MKNGILYNRFGGIYYQGSYNEETRKPMGEGNMYFENGMIKYFGNFNENGVPEGNQIIEFDENGN